MKKILLCSALFVLIGMCAFAQKYKTASDTAKLNKEYASVLKDVANLTSKLTTAQNNLPGYQSKASNAMSDAQNTAQQSSEQAAKANGDDVGDAKKAKKKANKALKDAKQSEKAQEKVKDDEKEIDKLNKELSKKQQRLQELDAMRTAIRNGQQ